MGAEIAFENCRISECQGLLTLTLTLDRVTLHTVMHHSSTSTYVLNFIEIEESFCGRTDGRTGGQTFETGFVRSTRKCRPNKCAPLAVWMRTTPLCALLPTRLVALTRARYSVSKLRPSTEQAPPRPRYTSCMLITTSSRNVRHSSVFTDAWGTKQSYNG